MKTFFPRGTGARFSLALGVILILSAAIRLWDPRADAPLDGAKDLSLTTDGAWYAGAELDRARGLPPEGGGPYDQPLHGLLLRGAIALAGPGLEAAALVSAFCGVLAIFFTALAARRMRGEAAGLLAAGLLAADYAFLVHGRAPNIYAPAAMLASIALFLVAAPAGGPSPSRLRLAAAGGVLLAGAMGVKSILALSIPALIAISLGDTTRRFLRSRWKILAAGVGGSLALATAVAVCQGSGPLAEMRHRLAEYLQGGPGESNWAGGPWRFFTLESRSGLWGSSPLLLLTAVLALAWAPPCGAAERFCRWSLGAAVGFLAILAYSPLRYFIPSYPALALLGGSFLAGLGRSPGAERPPGSSIRWILPGYLALQPLFALWQVDGREVWTSAVVLILEVAAACLWWRRRQPVQAGAIEPSRSWKRLAIAGIILMGALFQLGRGGVALAEPRHSILHSARELEAMVPTSAYLTGPFAHALTQESPIRRKYIPRLLFGGGRLGRNLRREGFTHLATDLPADPRPLLGAFRSDGAELEPIWEFRIRGARVGLFRFPWADDLCPRSPFEEGVALLHSPDPARAEGPLRIALADHPASSACAAALGLCLRAQGREGEARFLLGQVQSEDRDGIFASAADQPAR